MKIDLDARTLRVVVLVAGLVPVGAGLAGILMGDHMTGEAGSAALVGPAGLPSVSSPAGLPALDSHVRYLSGLLLGIGLAFWSTIPRIETAGQRFRLLTAIVFVGGLGRLYGILTVGVPPWPMLFGLAMELVVTPLLCLWQWQLEREIGRESGRRIGRP